MITMSLHNAKHDHITKQKGGKISLQRNLLLKERLQGLRKDRNLKLEEVAEAMEEYEHGETISDKDINWD